MMDREKCEKTAEFLKTELMKSADFEGESVRVAEYRIEHSYRVANIGAKIALAEGLDVEKTYLACLLHDVGYAVEMKSEADYRNHGRIGARLARPFLRSLGYSEEAVNEMCYAIAIHVDDQADFEGERTPLALTVQDADNIDRCIGVITGAFRLHSRGSLWKKPFRGCQSSGSCPAEP